MVSRRQIRWVCMLIAVIGALAIGAAGGLPHAVQGAQPPPTVGGMGQIGFVSTRDGNYEIYRVNVDGTELINLTNNSALDYYPAWSPDGSTIAFNSGRDNTLQIYLMNADGSNVRWIANGKQPAWSPDGSKIVFQYFADLSARLGIINADGTGLTIITSYMYAASAPSWSPDGERIIYISHANTRQIETVRTDGTDNRVLVVGVGFETLDNPFWSPDGQRIYFNGSEGSHNVLNIIDADGDNRRTIIPPDGDVSDAASSPDGRVMAVNCDRSVGVNICLMTPDGKILSTVVNGSINFQSTWNPASGSGLPPGVKWSLSYLPLINQ